MQLAVQKRTITGKKVKSLRKKSLVPCIIYGPHLESPHCIAIDKVQLVKAYNAAGMSTALQLTGDGVDELVLFHDIQVHPVSDHVMHVDFIAVEKDKKVTADVPLVFTWVSPFEKNALGSVQQIKYSLEVEAFPLDLPQELLVDISSIEQDGQVIFVKDVITWENVVIMDDLEQAIATATSFVEEKVEEEEETLTEEETVDQAEESVE